MKPVALAVIACAGCNQLWGFGDPALAPDDPQSPSCATGWTYRAPIAVDNPSGIELRDFQVPVDLDTGDFIVRGELAPSGADLRFASGSGSGHFPLQIESGLDSPHATVWTSVPVIPPGGTTFYVYYGNSVAPPLAESPFVQGVIENPSFEAFGAWTVDADGPAAVIDMTHEAWATDGLGSLYIDEEVNGLRIGGSSTQLSQMTTFPDGADYVIRLDVDVLVWSEGSDNRGGLYLALGGGDIAKLWAIGPPDRTGIYLEAETGHFGPGTAPLSIVANVDPGDAHGYVKAMVDNLRVRKWADPAPATTVGAEELVCP